MKQFLIKYSFRNGTRESWHERVQEFIARLDGDAELQGKISYRCLKERDGDGYYHLAEVADEQTAKVLQSRDFFHRYTEQTKLVGGGAVEVVPLELIAQTS